MRPNNKAIEHLKPEDLVVSKRQAREHPAAQIEALASSILRFGFTVPILIDEKGRILAGHGRLLAARKLDLREVPCLRVNHLSEDDKRAYILADNRLAELSHWNKEVLAAELQDLGDLGFPVQLTGFSLPEVDLLLGEVAEASQDTQDKDQDEIPPLEPRAVTRKGDLWVCGRHLQFCGDARDPGARVQVLGTSKADMVFTDLPYNLSISRDLSHQGATRHREFAMASGELSKAEFLAFLIESHRAIASVSRDGAIIFSCCDWRHVKDFIAAGEAAGLTLKNLVVWQKTNAGMGTFYRSAHELILVWKFGTAAHTNTFGLGDKGRHRTNVWTHAGVNTFKADRSDELAYHPTCKPSGMVIEAIRDVSHRGQLVFDPFGGSGTTLIAAERTGRSARLIEIDPHYCDVAVRRFEKLTGQFARLSGTAKTFGEIAIERAAEQDAPVTQ